MKYLLLLLLTSCASAPMDYGKRMDKCLEVMRKNEVPICKRDDLFKESPYGVGWEVGFSSGYFQGCVDSGVGEK